VIGPSQRAVFATLVVALYASFLSFHSLSRSNDRLESSRYAEMKVKLWNFPMDHIRDPHIPTAVSFLTSHRCYKAARTVAGLAGDCQRAGEPCLLPASADGSRALLDLPGLKGSHNDVAELLKFRS
jgi:hypothetical protein